MTDFGFKERVAQGIQAGPFRDDWTSLTAYRVPQWFEDSKFGIFIHWGVYSVPAFGSEWYPREMYVEGTKEFAHHRATYGDHRTFGYKDFIAQFTAEKFDADEWAELFRRAGAQYVVPVAEHHDGFAMYDTRLSDWNAAKMGPKRDVIGLLAEAVRRQWLVFGLSSHRAEHWWFYNGGMRFPSDVSVARYAGLYGPAQSDALPPNEAFLEDWLNRTVELVDKYEPQVVWFDWWIEQPAFAPYLRKFAAYYYNRAAEWQRGVVINYKYEAFPPGTAVYDIERGQTPNIRQPFWQTDTGLSKNSWGYVEPQRYKTASEVIGDLADIVSKNGSLLMNIGPKADGTIPQAEQDILLEVGRWLGLNGEAIYGTRPWRMFGEGPTPVVSGPFNDSKRRAFTAEDIRFTARGETLYAIVMGWPARGRLRIEALKGPLSPALKVELLGSSESVRFSPGEGGLSVVLPKARTLPDGPVVLKIGPVARER